MPDLGKTQADMVKRAFFTMTEELQKTRDKISLYESMLGPGAAHINPTPSKPSMIDKHGPEHAIMMLERLRPREKELVRTIKSYVDVIDEESWLHYLMWRRYVDGAEWKQIQREIFGRERDFFTKNSKYRRKLFRGHDSALKVIWLNFGKVKQPHPREPPEKYKEG